MSEIPVMQPVVKANIETIEQGLQLLSSLTHKAYTYRFTSVVNSSIGEHFRHIIDAYFARELVFTSSHAIHHYALISIIAKLQGLEIDAKLGIAPATASHLRKQA